MRRCISPSAFRLVIVGAGPSGLMAAATAAERGLRVLLLERLPAPGQKLLATGGGRCNLTRDLPPRDIVRVFSRGHAPTARFLAPAIHHFPPEKIRQWFHDRGVPTVAEPDGCVYPASNSSRDILNALLRACDHPNIQLRLNARVTALGVRGSCPAITVSLQLEPVQNLRNGVFASHGDASFGRKRMQKSIASRRDASLAAEGRIPTGCDEFSYAFSTERCIPMGCKNPVPKILNKRLQGGSPAPPETLRGGSIILATGGLSFPSLGADPSILALLANLGLDITPPVPALVPLVANTAALPQTAPPWTSLAGVALENARVSWQVPAPATNATRGALLFTHNGLSGPAVLEISRDFSLQPSSFSLFISTRADRDAASWHSLFASWRARRGAAHLRNLLSGEIPRAWAEYLFAALSLPPALTAARATRGNLDALATALAAFPVPVSGTGGFARAMVTRGGVALSELDPQTLGCRRFPRLRVIGELPDLDGPCGGFNLTWAFASAHLCASGV